jgi:hypothetical protein
MKRFLPVDLTICFRTHTAQSVVIPLNSGSFLPPQILSLLRLLLLTLALLSVMPLFAQTDEGKDAAYKKVIHDRVVKFVDPLNIANADDYNKVVDIISQRYYAINTIAENNKAAIAAIKSQNLSTEEKGALLVKEEAKRLEVLKKGHVDFLTALQTKLSTEQVEKVKDGMTYRVLHVTYEAYVDMIPSLTTEQKEKILGWLVEARELAMDGESSDAKHKIFGKYKGRINNYLSVQGIDMKKEESEWQARIKERKEKANK